MKNRPSRIYLNLGDITKGELVGSDFEKDYHDLTWCSEKLFDHDLQYVGEGGYVYMVNCMGDFSSAPSTLSLHLTESGAKNSVRIRRLCDYSKFVKALKYRGIFANKSFKNSHFFEEYFITKHKLNK